MHTLSYEQLQYIYPEFHSFLQVRKSLDELGMFLILMQKSYLSRYLSGSNTLVAKFGGR
ncbi:hypothetical protein LQK80_27245 [Bacillus thuringiensis]|nr:hypothetical protein [Bacillus thuringiensis]